MLSLLLDDSTASAWAREQMADKRLGHGAGNGLCAFVVSVTKTVSHEGHPFDASLVIAARDMRANPEWLESARLLVGEKIRGSQHKPPRQGYNLTTSERLPGRWWTACSGEVG
jgi:hypothetical protein